MSFKKSILINGINLNELLLLEGCQRHSWLWIIKHFLDIAIKGNLKNFGCLRIKLTFFIMSNSKSV
jgi:hypothetical protein